MNVRGLAVVYARERMRRRLCTLPRVCKFTVCVSLPQPIGVCASVSLRDKIRSWKFWAAEARESKEDERSPSASSRKSFFSSNHVSDIETTGCGIIYKSFFTEIWQILRPPPLMRVASVELLSICLMDSFSHAYWKLFATTEWFLNLCICESGWLYRCLWCCLRSEEHQTTL